jgi:hypothetical protein
MKSLRSIRGAVRAGALHRRKGRTMSRSNESGESNPDMRAVKAAAKIQFANVDGVEGIGIGDRALRVYVRSEDVAKDLPKEFQGVRVDYVVTGKITLYDAGAKGR